MGMALWDYMSDVVLKLQMGMTVNCYPGRNGNTICCVYCTYCVVIWISEREKTEREKEAQKREAKVTVRYCTVLHCTVP